MLINMYSVKRKDFEDKSIWMDDVAFENQTLNDERVNVWPRHDGTAMNKVETTVTRNSLWN